MPNRVASWPGSSPRYCAWATQLVGYTDLMRPARDLNLVHPAPEMNALQFD